TVTAQPPTHARRCGTRRASWSPAALRPLHDALAACSRRPEAGESPLPPHRTDEPDRRETLGLEAMGVDTPIHPRPELTPLRALPMVLIETCSLPSQKDPGGHTIIPLPQIGRSAKDRDGVPEQDIFVTGHDVRAAPW